MTKDSFVLMARSRPNPERKGATPFYYNSGKLVLQQNFRVSTA